MRTGTLTGTPLASKTGALPRSCYLSVRGPVTGERGLASLDDSAHKDALV